MSITLEKLDDIWNSRDKDSPPYNLVAISLRSKALIYFLKIQPNPKGYEDILALIVSAFSAGLHLGYEIAKAEKLEELINV